jgi:hypothetical protein
VTLVRGALKLRLINISQSSLVTLARLAAQSRLITISIAETVTLARLRTLARPISIAQVQLVTLGRATRTSILLATSQLVSLPRRMAHSVLVSMASFVSLSRSSATLKTVAVQIGESLILASIKAKTVTSVVASSSKVTVAEKLTRSVVTLLLLSQNVSLVRRGALTIRLSTIEAVTLRRLAATTITIKESQFVRLFASATRKHTITLTTPLAVVLTTSLHVVTEFAQTISVGIGQLIRLLAQIVKGRPRSEHLRAWELATQLQAYEEVPRNLKASEPSAELEASKTRPKLKVGP